MRTGPSHHLPDYHIWFHNDLRKTSKLTDKLWWRNWGTLFVWRLLPCLDMTKAQLWTHQLTNAAGLPNSSTICKLCLLNLCSLLSMPSFPASSPHAKFQTQQGHVRLEPPICSQWQQRKEEPPGLPRVTHVEVQEGSCWIWPYPNVYVYYLLLATKKNPNIWVLLKIAYPKTQWWMIIFFCEIATVGGKLEVYPISRHTCIHHIKSAFLADSWRRSTTAMIWCGTTWGSWPNLASHRGHRPAGIQESLAEAPCTSQFSFKTCLMSH